MVEEIDKGYINKKEKGSGEFENLYLEGIELLQKLSGAQWTDYNEHDPGVTILENIAYTMTNLSHKTTLPIKDILVESKGAKLESGDNGFFVPSEILTTNPITVDDYRKLFIDRITNVKDVWIKPQLQDRGDDIHNIYSYNLQGLYHIYVDLYNYADDSIALKNEEDRIVNEVRDLFHKHRNLCEDLYDVTINKPFKLHMKLSLKLDETVCGEEIFAKIFYNINDYLSHEVRFNSLWELLDDNEDINTIFNGPLLENGFICNKELKGRLNQIVSSIILKIVAKVSGVISVNYFELCYNDSLASDSLKKIKEEGVDIPKNHSPILMFPESNADLILETDGVKFSPDLTEVQKQLSYIQAMNFGSFKSISQSLNTIDIPNGQALGIASYHSIREQFPIAYGVGQFGLQTGLPHKRYAQANQLKAYLLPFDQLMTNFLAQLTHLYAIYDVKEQGLNSYFYKNLDDMQDLIQLIKTNEDEDKEDSIENWKGVLEKLNTNYDQSALKRLNQIADNLLARFSEEFPTYSLKKIHMNCYGKNETNQQFDEYLLAWKRKLIANYGELSYNRTKAYDYTKPISNINDLSRGVKGNHIIPGIIKKVAILMGIKYYSTRSISKIIEDSGIRIYQKEGGLELISEELELVYSKNQVQAVIVEEILIVDDTVKNLTDSFYYLGHSGNILKDVLREGVLLKNYQIKETASDKKDLYYILFNENEKRSNVLHIADSKKEAQKAVNNSVNFLVDLNEKCEGLYLIEHLLLAPPYHLRKFGFSFSIPLKENVFIDFKQSSLLPIDDRNGCAEEIVLNLIGSGTLQFRRITTNEKYSIQILDKDGKQLAITTNLYDNKEDAEAHIKLIVDQLYTFELGQFNDAIEYFAYYGENKVNETFFSFQMSIILPSWPVRFQDINFRTKFDNIVYEHAPVHIVSKSYWIDLHELSGFEKVYFKWLELVSDNLMAEEQMKYAYDLITKIQHF